MARSQSDIPVTAPRRRPAKPKAKRAAKRRSFVPAFMLSHPGRTAACAVVAAVLTGIVLNAAFFQNGRHPAPLFSSAPTLTPPRPVATGVTTVPVPAPRPSDFASASTLTPQADVPPAVVAAPTPSATPVRAAPPVPHARIQQARVEPAEPRRDLIGALLKNEVVPEPSDRVAAAQKALLRAGYVLRSDGLMGLGTKKTIEQFQRDRGLTVTGELNDRTLRELRSLTSVAIP